MWNQLGIFGQAGGKSPKMAEAGREVASAASVTVKSVLAVKEKFTIKSQNRVAMVQISWEITR